MRIIEIAALSNGAHRNQKNSGVLSVPVGWAVIPDDMLIPDTFPFVDIAVVGGEDAPVVVSMTAGVVPDPEPVPVPDPEPTDTEVLNVLLGVEE